MSFLLSVGFTFASLALRSSIVSTYARDSALAYYAAETGYECVVYWDIEEEAFDPDNSKKIKCDGKEKTVGGAGSQEFSFEFDTLTYQVRVALERTTQRVGSLVWALRSDVDAQGINHFSSSHPRRVSRLLQVNIDHVPNCPFDATSVSGRYVIEFNGHDIFPRGGLWQNHRFPWLTAFPPKHKDHPDETLPPITTMNGGAELNIPPGIYKVTLVSFDDHAMKLSQAQDNEQWFVRFYSDTDGMEDGRIAETDLISDIPNTLNYLVEEEVHSGFLLPQPASSVRAWHIHEKDGTTSNSVWPVCAVLTQVSGVNVPPTASFTTRSLTPVVMEFDASNSNDIDGDIVSWAWNFGDGNGGSGEIVTHQYTPGTYNVTLTVTDNNGVDDSTTRQVNVARGGGPSGGASGCIRRVPSLTKRNVLGGIGARMEFTGEMKQGNSCTPSRWIWDFGNGSPEETTGMSKTSTVDTVYTNSGNYTVKVEAVFDPSGSTPGTSQYNSILVECTGAWPNVTCN